MTKRIRKKKHRINTNIKHNTISNSKNDDDFIMQPKVDYCFKELMKNKTISKGFLSAILGIEPAEIKSIDLLPTELEKNSVDDKLGILDVKILLNSYKYIDMEIQVSYFPFWQERSLFYLCKMFTEQLKVGEEYDQLNKCIHVGILNFNLFEEYREFYSLFHISEDTRHIVYSDKLELHLLELHKLKFATDITKNNSLLYDWCRFFSINNKKELNDMYGKNEYIDEACNQILKLSADEMKKLEYDQRFKKLCDHNTQMNYNYRKGHDEGFTKGHSKGFSEGHNEGFSKGHSKGFSEGHNEGTFDTLATLYNSGNISLDVAANTLNISKEQFLSKLKNI